MSDQLLLFDDTLEDGPLPTPRDRDLRRLLVDQRFVHGLLRSMHSADASSREARIQSILERLPVPLERVSRRPGWLAPAVAAVVLVACGLVFLAPLLSPVPRIHAAVERAVKRLAQAEAQHYTVDVRLTRDRGGEQVRQAQYDLTVGGNRRFLLEGDGLFGRVRVGFDGETLWCLPAAALLRWARPWQPRHRLGSLLSPGPIEAGDLDLTALVSLLKDRAERVSLDVVSAAAGEPTRLRIEADQLGARRDVEVMHISVEVEEDSGRLVLLEVHTRRGRWIKIVDLKSVERPDAQVRDEDFRRPW